MNMDKIKLLLAGLCLTLFATTIAMGFSRLVLLFPQHYQVIEQPTYVIGPQSDVGQLQWKTEIHASIRQWRWVDTEKYLIFSYNHPAVLTSIGENLTCGKLTGAVFPVADYLYNVTFIALGDDNGLSAASTVLPSEWNRSSSLTPEYLGVGHFNLSFSFYPSGSGTTNATSLNWKTGIGTDDCMWCYDTFATISYTSNDQIDVEFEVDTTYS